MTARFVADAPWQRTGHGQYAETRDGLPDHANLSGRPLPAPRGAFCALGRETGLARCVWRDDWLYPEAVPPASVAGLPAPGAETPVARVFTARDLLPEFQWLRTPDPDRLFTLTGDALRMTGRESIGSWFEQATVSRRRGHHCHDAGTVLLADPPNRQLGAELVACCKRRKFHAFPVTQEPGAGRCLRVMSCKGD
jgi:xylan 1,4-beta-xylosidase